MDRIKTEGLRIMENKSIKAIAQKSLKLKTQMSSYFKVALRAHHLKDEDAFSNALERVSELNLRRLN